MQNNCGIINPDSFNKICLKICELIQLWQFDLEADFMRKYIPLHRNKKIFRLSFHHAIMRSFLSRDKIWKLVWSKNCKQKADKNLVKNINKGIMLLSLNLQQMILFIQKVIYKKVSTVKPLYSGHLRFLKKVSTLRRWQLYRVLDFYEERIIIDKNLSIFYVNSLQFISEKTYG